jgi:flagellar hook protein FlgE
MSLFGAMTSGVSGLAAQSSAMGAIADNITNVNTVGYKGTSVDFQTLVTKQSSSTFYSAGGVQSAPRAGIDVQGLLQSSSAQTNLAISGDGFFLVNEGAQPSDGGQFLYSRAGAFYPDQEGFLRNTGGYYLQGWPTDAQGNVVLPSGSAAAVANQNIISDEFLETVNLNRVGGAVAASSEISIGANLPANDPVGSRHNVDLQFFDTLGNGNSVTLGFTKTATNEWDLSVEPPIGTSMVNLYDDAGEVYTSVGQLEFTAVPAVGESVFVGGTQYTFVAGAAADNQIQVDGGRALSDVVRDLATQINTDTPGATASIGNGNSAVLVLTGDTASVAVDPNGVVDAGGAAAIRQSGAFSVLAPSAAITGPGIQFGPQGFPIGFNVSEMEVVGFESGAASMDGSGTVARIALNVGTVGQGDGLTQYGAEFNPRFIEQNGSQFGNFSGVSIGDDGVVSALFDNGERRAIYKLPLVTFVNPNALQAASGNAWTATEGSGSPTLREADSGAAGQIVQSSLEASTVDIGEEFTSMIIVQRAYSAATRIISTADEMLEELVRIKR